MAQTQIERKKERKKESPLDICQAKLKDYPLDTTEAQARTQATSHISSDESHVQLAC